MKWSRPNGRPPLRDYWRKRESGWRSLRIRAREHGGYFTRYDYAKLWVKQKGVCGVCDKPLNPKVFQWVSGFHEVGVGRGIDVDHGHHTGFARSLVHGRCNRMVGLMDAHMALLVLNYLLKQDGAPAYRPEVAP